MKRTGFKAAVKAMVRSAFRPRKPAKFKRRTRSDSDPHRLMMIHALECVICAKFHLQQTSPTQAHHCIHGRFSTKKAPDEDTMPICEGHHMGLRDTSKIALHREPKKWRELYGDDTDYLKHVNDKLRRL